MSQMTASFERSPVSTKHWRFEPHFAQSTFAHICSSNMSISGSGDSEESGVVDIEGELDGPVGTGECGGLVVLGVGEGEDEKDVDGVGVDDRDIDDVGVGVGGVDVAAAGVDGAGEDGAGEDGVGEGDSNSSHFSLYSTSASFSS